MKSSNVLVFSKFSFVGRMKVGEKILPTPVISHSPFVHLLK